jgi:two-component system phosphate regulon sensor histidine kinase PhoR
LSRYRLLILALVLVPAILLTVGEYLSMKENEAMITVTYNRQVEGILYSLNQNAWDVVTNWVTDYETRLRRGDTRPITDRSDALLAVVSLPELIEAGIEPARLDIQRDQFLQGYRRFESKSDSTGFMLWFALDDGDTEPTIAGFRIDSDRFIANEMAAALGLAGSEGVGIGIFSAADSTAIHTTQDFSLSDARFTRSFWLMPDYVLAIHTQDDPLESQLRARTIRAGILILIVLIVLVFGLWYVDRAVKRETELARLKSDFVANVSHELKTPLALIRMFAETLEMGRIPDEAKKQEYYRIIGNESARLTHLIQNILNFSKMEAGKKTYVFEPASIHDIIRNVMGMYGDILSRDGIHVELDLDEAVPDVNVDRDAITEAILNLIDNAMKYAGSGKWIGIQTRPLRARGVELTVADRGPGIATDDHERIFETFYRSGGTLVHDTKGTGLGLSLVKHIVTAHGGTIHVESEPGKGARFVIRIQTSL